MTTRFFEQSKGTIAYDDSQGDGELVLMLPGMGDLRSEYRFLAPALVSAGYRVVTADLRGHGESSVDWPEYTLPAAGQDILPNRGAECLGCRRAGRHPRPGL